MYRVIADGTEWVDADGRSRWNRREADTLAAHLEGMGYAVWVRR